MIKSDWKQAVLNEAEATAEADAAWATEAAAYAKDRDARKMLTFLGAALLAKLVVPLLTILAFKLTADMLCTQAEGCILALFGVVPVAALLGASLGYVMGKRGMGFGWFIALAVVSGDMFRHTAELLGWGLISLPDFALYTFAFALPLILAQIFGLKHSLEIR